jgi:3',5'-cyclic AMP phosphodiesterase CpdA
MNKNLLHIVIVSAVSLMLFSCASQKARFVLLPDTQYYAEKFPEVLDAQVNWIAANAGKIDMVLQQGDLTQNNNDREWEIVQKAFAKIEGQTPYVLALGNHDMGSVPGKFADVRNTDLFNRYFPFEKMSSVKTFGGAFEQGKMDNAYYLLQTGKIKWLVMSLEFGPRNEVLEWADKIAADHRNRTIILNTHSYMYSDSTRQGPGDSWRPQGYGIGKDSAEKAVNDGEQIWNKLVRKHPHISFVFSGHVLNSGVGTLVSINDHGNYVYQMLANYQSEVKGSVKGGNGWLRILDMDFKKKTLKVTTYSPFVNEYKTDPAHNFHIKHVEYDVRKF